MFDPLTIIAVIIGLLVAFIVHEYAHARAAYSLGDPTSKYDGRLTLNPAVHLDPIGSLILVITAVGSQGRMPMGWAKPVMFNRDNFKNPWGDGALVAIAGPFANFIVAILAGALFRVCPAGSVPAFFLMWMVKMNMVFGLFNSFPLPPLDGWKILQAFVPVGLARTMQDFEDKLGRAAPLVLLLVSPFVISPILSVPYFYSVSALTGTYF